MTLDTGEEILKKIYIISAVIFAFLVLILGVFGILLVGSSIGSGNIALIDLNGPISSQTTQAGLFGEYEPNVDDYIEWIEDAADDSGTGAIVIKINSPGGEVIASEKLARSIKAASEKKVVVAYIETLGASAAYQAASSADYIVAEKQSLVGNIGVRMEIIHYYGLMEKLGVNVTTIKSGEYKDIGSPTRPMTEEEQKMLESIVDESYYEFISWVAENRNMTINETLQVAEGKIYSGTQAEKAGLVDMTGTEDDAIEIAAKMADISEPEVYRYQSPSSGILGMDLNDVSYALGYGIGKGLSQTSLEDSVRSYQMYY